MQITDKYGATREVPILKLAFLLVAFLVSTVALPNVVEHLDATDLMVIQSPSGKLTWHTTPGWKAQWFGGVTKYKKRSQYEFSGASALDVQFNDGGHAKINGSIAWEMPSDDPTLTKLHSQYGTQREVESKLIRTVVDKAVYMTGPTMSSTESYAEKKTELIRLIGDQVNHGVFQTVIRQSKGKDPISGVERTVTVSEVAKDAAGNPVRQEKSPLEEFGLKAFNLSIAKLEYDTSIGKQIQEQQASVMQVQTAMASAKKAEQAVITAEKEGEANAAKAKWAQEVIKATEVTKAEQALRVAELDAKAAEQEKRAAILRGEGQAEARRLVMAADNALQVKIDKEIKINEVWAKAFAESKHPLVPSIVFGGSSSQSSVGNAQSIIEMLAVNQAKGLTNSK